MQADAKTIQFNSPMSKDLATRVRVAAVENGVNLEAITTEAFLKFFSLPIAQRREILSKHRKGATGRKIATTLQKNFPSANGVKPAKGAKE